MCKKEKPKHGDQRDGTDGRERYAGYGHSRWVSEAEFQSLFGTDRFGAVRE